MVDEYDEFFKTLSLKIKKFDEITFKRRNIFNTSDVNVLRQLMRNKLRANYFKYDLSKYIDQIKRLDIILNVNTPTMDQIVAEETEFFEQLQNKTLKELRSLERLPYIEDNNITSMTDKLDTTFKVIADEDYNDPSITYEEAMKYLDKIKKILSKSEDFVPPNWTPVGEEHYYKCVMAQLPRLTLEHSLQESLKSYEKLNAIQKQLPTSYSSRKRIN